MKYTIAIDMGTTNTRCTLLDEERREIDVEKRAIGVRVTAIEGSNDKIRATVRECMEALLARNGIGYAQIERVLASGMISSNVGLYELPHLTAPVGKEELARGMVAVRMEAVCPLPIWFIPGVKNPCATVDTEHFEAMDMMRGEEVESIAMLESLPRGRRYLLALPGSHTKFVSADEQGKITGCLTTIGGELLSAVVHDTIIADAVGGRFIEQEELDREMLLLGFRTAAQVGVARACFSGRILNTFAIKEKARIGSYIAGAVLQSDIAALRNSSALPVDKQTAVVISGKEPLCGMLTELLREDGYFESVSVYRPQHGGALSAVGASMIADCRIQRE